MPLQILEVPSKLFYSNSLVAKATFPPTGPQDIPPVGFVGVDGQEKREEDSPSLQNLLEAEKVAAKVRACMYVRMHLLVQVDETLIVAWTVD